MKPGVLLIFVAFGCSVSEAVTYTVTTTNDSGPGSLREAIIVANDWSAGPDTIDFAVTGSINLTSPLPAITDSVIIAGPGTNLLRLSGNNEVQIFTLNAGTTNIICGLSISDGVATANSNGAAVCNYSTLIISNCALFNNRTFGGWGGALFNSSNLIVVNSSFSGNLATGENGGDNGNFGTAGGGGAGMGGALFSYSGAVFLSGCCFLGNAASGGNGGAYRNSGTGNGRGGGVNGGALGLPNAPAGGVGGFGGGGGGGPYCGYGGVGGFGGGGGGGGYCNAPEQHGGAAGVGGGSGGIGGINWGGNGGGGAAFGGGVFVHNGSVAISRCAFVGNQVGGGLAGAGDARGQAADGVAMGGGIFVQNGTVSIITSSFASNRITSAGAGADFYNYAGTITPRLTVSSGGGGFIVATPQSPPYLTNSLATVSATPDPGWALVQWLGDASGNNSPITVSVTRNKYIEGIFGTSIAVASNVIISPQMPLFPFGSTVKITALPPAGTYFQNWTGDVTGTNNPTSLVVTTANPSVSCQFGALASGEYSLTILENGKGHVQVSPVKSHYTNENVTMLAVADPGQGFFGWGVDATGTQNPILLAMGLSKTVSARFTTRPTLRVGTPIEGLSEDGFRLTIEGEFGATYSVFSSTNFQDWSLVGTVTNTFGTAQVTDSGATNQTCTFYRAVLDQ